MLVFHKFHVRRPPATIQHAAIDEGPCIYMAIDEGPCIYGYYFKEKDLSDDHGSYLNQTILCYLLNLKLN